MLRPPMHRSVLSAACVAASLTVFAACSSSSRPHTATSPIPSGVSTAAPARNAAANRNPATAWAEAPPCSPTPTATTRRRVFQRH